MRKPIIAGNWKMNMTPSEAKTLIDGILPLVKEYIKGTNIHLGAQNMHWEEKGAFTGEVSPLMLNELEVEYVILGHSERRQYFAETDETVNKKVLSALAHNLKPIVCVGETLEQREEGITDKLVSDQTIAALQGVKDFSTIVIAYEPVWAIGTGKTATADEANRVCGVIRAAIAKEFGAEVGENIRIQYGGSMNAGNVADLMAQPEIDGGLIGGAALKPVDFSKLVNNQ